MSSNGKALVWFRRDLRATDNPALHAALQQCESVIPVYIHAPQEESPWSPGQASNWWLHHSLHALQKTLRAHNSELLVCQGPTQELLPKLIEQLGITHLFWNRLYEPAIRKRDRKLEQQLQTLGIECHHFNSHLLIEPQQILTQQGTPYRVFGAYWRRCLGNLRTPSQPLSEAGQINTPSPSIDNQPIDALDLLDKTPWYRGFEEVWQPGEAGAMAAWQRFQEQTLVDYESARDIPEIEGTSRLSPHLHFGEISPAQLLWGLQQAADRHPANSGATEGFLSQLGWREFAHYTLYHFPQTDSRSLDDRFDPVAWDSSAQSRERLRKWQRGETGIPIVDAGMQELWQTGWMHNRVRMIVASLLTKNLGIHWIEGARWFWDTLVDADLANNSLGWQWTAGCGVDAAPYFRIFNPARQAERFDPRGDYIQRWLPQLEGRDQRILYHGCRADDPTMPYPTPMLDLAETRRNALQRWEEIKRRPKGDS